ncbi:carboxypeptidase-like regulatory domain-containing protein [Streptococcus pseudopneumoniae]|uniref:carboxypeptidase-like regulatory domain-containing protein n=1 Tax=Streptococcus pseudopneumoniae TaxID=257758 RepID=UPI00066D330C|nr:carboxypeptidase-like regulatory domain-containing protein [Streptococcus pseudopneumoniae]
MGCNLNTTNLDQVDGGHLIKQGDVASTFGFVLLNEDYRAVSSLEGKVAVVSLTMGKYQWKKKVTVTNSGVNFNLDAILPIGEYRLEVSAGGYIFPSDKETHIKIVASDKELVTEEVHALKELDIAEEVKKQLAERPASEGGVCPEIPDLLMYYNLGKV